MIRSFLGASSTQNKTKVGTHNLEPDGNGKHEEMF